MSERRDIVDAHVGRERRAYHARIEAGLRLCIRPKPRWLPDFLWRRVLARVLYLEQDIYNKGNNERATTKTDLPTL